METITNIDKKQKVLLNMDHTSLIKSYLKKHITDDKMRNEIYQLHKKVYEQIMEDNNEKINIGGLHWKILGLKFSNVFSYGKENIIDFRKYQTNRIIGIFAPNHYGKSAILDIILFCLFDKCSRGVAIDIINKNEKEMECSIYFSIGNDKYTINRTLVRGKNDQRSKQTINFTKIGTKKNINLNGNNKNQTNKKIIELIGSYDDYLTSHISVQEHNKYENFTDKTNMKKKEYLYESLKLDMFDLCYNHIHDKLKICEGELKSLEEQIDSISINNMEKEIKKLHKQLIKLDKEKLVVHNLTKLNENCLQLHKPPVFVKYNELSSYQIENDDDIDATIEKITIKINKNNPGQILKKILKYENEITELKKSKKINDKLLSTHNVRLEDFYAELVKIPAEVDDNNLDDLRNERKYIQNTIKKITKSMNELKIQIKSAKQSETKIIGQKQHDIMVDRLKVKNNFKKHVAKTIDYLKQFKNNKRIKLALELQYEWLDKYNEWKKEAQIILECDAVDLPKIKNNIKHQTDQLDVLADKLNMTNEKIKIIKKYQKYLVSNKKINKAINGVKTDIEVIRFENITIKDKIKKIKEQIEDCSNEMEKKHVYKKHLILLDKYRIQLADYHLKENVYNKILEEKEKLEISLNNIEQQIKDINNKITEQKKIIKHSEKIMEKYDDTMHKQKVYKLYHKIMDTNGVSYEILKTILPQIETKINQSLHNMVNFDIQFIFHQETKRKSKEKVKKTKMNAIDIYIHYQNQKPYNINLASGFEKFIIGLAIRIVLCEITKSAKPNFFIIDEGWSCLDDENLSNIDTIMNYIKNQFEHVIIISHLEALKSQADYIINIDRKNNYSYVKNFIKNKSKKKEIIEI